MSDPRFARLKSDPRFRRPKKQQSKIVVDDRFKSVFAPPKNKKSKGKSGRVDKYGRPVSENHDQENLRRFYRLENEDESVESQPAAPDYARGEVLLESSDEEEQNDSDEGDDFVTVGQDASRPISIRNDEAEIDLDENDFEDLDAQAAVYNESNPEFNAIPATTRTSRLAIVNLDWDHVRAVHLYKICSSLVSPTAPAVSSSSKMPSDSDKRHRNGKNGATSIIRGRVLSVKIYPSQFGKERLAREEKEGPPPEIFKRKQVYDDDEVTDQNIIQVGDENEFDGDALRKYQLERLRYYYAILICDSVDAASHIYDELEGTELERSANVFDLSFVPDDMTFEDEPRDEAIEDEGAAYKGVEFVTDALRHSKVKLTWDNDDPIRNQMTRRRISRKELEEADFKAYLASSSSESESDGEAKQKSASRDKLRSLLLGGGNDLPEGWNEGDGGGDESDVDMEVTFAPGLSTTQEDKDETTLEKYQRKMKEKRKKKKEQGPTEAADEEEQVVRTDDFFAAVSDDENETNLSGKKSRKAKEKKSKTKEVATENELSLLVASSNAEPQHFNLKSVIKAEKLKGKKLKKGKTNLDEAELQEDFSIDVHDDRFKAVHENHDFAIDPSNPHYKKTEAMKILLNARSKQRTNSSSTQPRGGPSDQSLQSLADSIKRKSTSSASPKVGKRRKLL
ncbi:hypothetical protein J3R30DRAFT_3655351 [Lentinula aciculospora]|uniref:NUC153 domain-containing protein n=1 Tax=Lentinula aciculospora TaxID=153920 RepID=A0A9W9ANN0_9AGAR|nr:hypothetical protein J3R30DRAFT_3655351 [Lentinula aciculospora]